MPGDPVEEMVRGGEDEGRRGGGRRRTWMGIGQLKFLKVLFYEK